MEMVSLTITPAAQAKILSLVSSAPLVQPIVYLIEASGPIEVRTETSRAIVSGENAEAVRAAATKAVPSNWQALPRKLIAALYERRQLSKRHIVSIHNIEYYFPPPLAKRLNGCVLDFGDGRFEVTDASGRVVLPSV